MLACMAQLPPSHGYRQPADEAATSSPEEEPLPAVVLSLPSRGYLYAPGEGLRGPKPASPRPPRPPIVSRRNVAVVAFVALMLANVLGVGWYFASKLNKPPARPAALGRG
jgi:hypothetical protein